MEPRRVAAAAFGALALVTGCYATTPHRPEVQAIIARPACMAAIGDVFTRAAFVPMQTPRGYTAFFAPRMGVGQLHRVRAGTGVGVVVTDGPGSVGQGTCHVALEVLSNEGGCHEVEETECSSLRDARESPMLRSCQSDVMTCPLTSVPPSAEHDALVDDLARRLRAALGADATVTGLHAT